MTAPERNPEFRYMGIVGIGVVASLGLLAYLIHVGLQCSIRYSISYSVVAFGLFVYGAVFFHRIRGWVAAGPIIVDCGANPTKRDGVTAVVAAIVVAVFSGLFGFFGSLGVAHGLLGVIIFVTMAVDSAFRAFGRLQIRQNGLWLYCDLVRWDQLCRHEWRGADTCTLVLFGNRGLLGRGRWGALVAAAQKTTVDEYLTKHIAATT